MLTREWITLSHDVEALLIPSATPVTLRAGETVMITQALGSAFTVQVGGNLARVEGKDADALGLPPVTDNAQAERLADGLVEIEQVWEQLRTCYDPEIPVNIVDLGLIYRCEVKVIDAQHNKVEIEMTLTAPGCGMGPVLVKDIQEKLSKIKNVTDVDVQLVFDPPWNQSLMTEAAQLQLGLL